MTGTGQVGVLRNPASMSDAESLRARIRQLEDELGTLNTRLDELSNK
jgi:hypothetical protein